MLKSSLTKRREIDAARKIKECLYNLTIKVKEAVAKDICYTKVKNQDVALWKFIDCLVEHRVVDEIVQSAKPNTRKGTQELPCNHKEKWNREEKPMTDFDCQNKTDDSDDVDHTRKCTSSSRTKRIEISNREINDCLVLFNIKLQEAEHKGVFFTKVRGIEELSWKFLNCLVENKIIDERVLFGQKTKLHKDKDECHFVWNRRSTDPEIRHQQHLDLSDEEDKFKVDVASCSCAKSTAYYKCRISLLEKQNITLQKSLLRYEEDTNNLKVQRTRYESLANDYINKFKELQISTTEKYTNICSECEKNKQRMIRYRAQRDEQKLEMATLENNVSRLEINNNEKSLIIKEMKNILQEKLSEVKRLEYRCTHLQKVEKDAKELKKEKIQLETDNVSQRQNNETLTNRLEILNDEKLEIEARLRLHDDDVNSLETERKKHKSAMRKLEMQYDAVKNECVELLLKLQKIHNSSEISFEKLKSVIDKDIFGQKLEETTAQENMLAKETTKILENFASAKDKKGCVEVLKKRFEKALPKCDNGISSDEKTDEEDTTSSSSCMKYYEETVMESQATCHNRIHRTTNVTNFNIAGSNVSFNENTQQLSRLNGNNGQFPAIEEGN